MIPDSYRKLAEIVGIQPLLSMAMQYGGFNVYIPKYETLIRTARDDLIRGKYNGYNTDALAREYDISPRWVQEICRDLPLAGQMGFDDLM